MRWSWRLFAVRGIDIKVHLTFVLALLWGGFMWSNGSLSGAAYGVALTLLLFVVVVLHELGHAVAAQRYGILVHDIILLPIGGVARLDRMPDRPSQELIVALAGPAVNLILAVVLAPIVMGSLAFQAARGAYAGWPDITQPGLINLAAFMLLVNISLLFFNMLPAFPMDGGRVLRALIALRWSQRTATRIAVVVGRVFAVAFGALAIYTGNLFLGLVALFVFNGAGAEGQDTAEAPVARRERPPVLLSDTPAYLAFERLMRSPYPALAVVDDRGMFLGLVTRDGMQSRWAAGVRGPVGSFIEHGVPGD